MTTPGTTYWPPSADKDAPVSLLDELNARYKKMSDEAGALDERRKVLMRGMNELLPAIWALEAEVDKSKHTFDDGEAKRKADTDASANPALTSEPETHTGNGGEEFLLDPQSPSVDDEVRNKAEDAPPEVASEGEAGSNIQKVNITQPAVPEGWTPAAEFQFDGLVKAGERVPVVMALYEDGAECAGDNGIIGAWVFPTRDCRVIAYRILATPPGIIETPAEAERTEVDSQAQAATEQEQKDESTPVLDALPPSIPRSEIPEGAAVETFKDTGVETVKIGGITRIVEDVADQGQGDASVFAHGILEETKAEPERPSLIDRILGRAVPA